MKTIEEARDELLAAALGYRGPNHNTNDRIFSGPKYRLLVAAKEYKDAVRAQQGAP